MKMKQRLIEDIKGDFEGLQRLVDRIEHMDSQAAINLASRLNQLAKYANQFAAVVEYEREQHK